MPSRRRLLLFAGLGTLAAGLAAACLPWSVATPRAARFVSAGLQGAYGLGLTAEGPTEVALLPLPRVTFARVRLTGPEGRALAEGGRLTIELSLLSLLSGHAEMDAFSLDGATITLPAGADDPRWSAPLRRFAGRLSLGEASHPRRVSVTHATLVAADGTPLAGDAALNLSWPQWSTTLSAAAEATWRGMPARGSLAGLRPADLLAGAESPFTAAAEWGSGRLAAEGTGSLAEGLRASGRGSLVTRSLPETLAWLGGDVALSPFIEDFSLEGSFEASGQSVMLQRARVRVGSNSLDGAGSVTFGPERNAVQATLDAASLNLGPLLGGLVRVLDGDGRREGLALKPLLGGDLDLRLSTDSARIGPVLLDGVAASVLVRGGTIEAALNRAGLQGAVLKGRVALAAAGADGAETEVKAQGAFDRLDLGALLIDLGQFRWMLGTTQGQFALETGGADRAAMVERVAGRVLLASEGGSIAGLDLADVIHRNGAVAQGALARRNGRTPFERAAVALRFADGVGEIVEGDLKASALSASLRGRLFLPQRRFEARAELVPRLAGGVETATRPATLFAIAGPWDAVAVSSLRRGDAEPEGAARTGTQRAADPGRLPAALKLPAAARAYAP